jgi:hypothetical protein
MYMFKIFYNRLPSSVCALFCKLSAVESCKQLRHSQLNFDLIRCNTSHKQAFIVYNGSRMWNDLPDFIKSCNSLCLFKSHLKTHFWSNCD